MLTIGAILVGTETCSVELFGIVLTWVFNFSQCIQSNYTAKLNQNNVVSPFEINFFFAIVGLVATLVYNVLLSDNYDELQVIAASTTANPDELLMPMMALTGLLSVLLTLSMLSVVMVAGPTMVNIIGTVKDALLTYLGSESS